MSWASSARGSSSTTAGSRTRSGRSGCCKADCAISAHPDHLEARYAHRTRLLDCLWARLPIVCTEGDELADLVDLQELGTTAPTGDPEALSVALETVLSRGREAYRERLSEAAAAHSWARAAAPLVRWFDRPSARTAARGGSRLAGERARSGAYTAAARTASALNLRPPRLS